MTGRGLSLRERGLVEPRRIHAHHMGDRADAERLLGSPSHTGDLLIYRHATEHGLGFHPPRPRVAATAPRTCLARPVLGWEASGQIGVVKVDLPTVEQAVEAYFDDVKGRHLAETTVQKQRELLEGKLLPRS